MDAVKFITICDVLNFQQKSSTHIYIFISPSDEEMIVTHLWKVLVFKLYNSFKKMGHKIALKSS